MENDQGPQRVVWRPLPKPEILHHPQNWKRQDLKRYKIAGNEYRKNPGAAEKFVFGEDVTGKRCEPDGDTHHRQDNHEAVHQGRPECPIAKDRHETFGQEGFWNGKLGALLAVDLSI